MEGRVPRESRFEWYVMQVATGKERRMCELVRSIVPGEILKECFSPTYEVQKKVRGEWVRQSQLLFPGYSIVVTNQVERLGELLRAVPEFLRLLSVGETFVPLREDERAWIESVTREGSRQIQMSTGVKEGDRVVVTSGPLAGHEALIKSVNRHKSLAFLEFEICGRRVTTRVGLNIVGGSDI